jgi:hypothetical protein
MVQLFLRAGEERPTTTPPCLTCSSPVTHLAPARVSVLSAVPSFPPFSFSLSIEPNSASDLDIDPGDIDPPGRYLWGYILGRPLSHHAFAVNA